MLKHYLREYLRARPLFLSLIRAKEASLYEAYLPFKGPVLDVGAGDGFFARTVFKTIDVGLDVAQSRMEEARGLGVYKKLVAYDGVHFPFKDKMFTTVVSNCVLEHVPGLREVIRESYRVLKPGGKLIVTVMARPWEEHLVGALVMGNTYRNYMRRKQVHLNLLTAQQWRSAFTKAHFRIENEIGYLSPASCKLIDICHYLSVPSLVTYVLFKKWMLFPALVVLYPVSLLVRILRPNVALNDSGAIFFVLGK